ncbi:MAG TPA: PIG-L family deacetylase [Bryobacteraceae bacterium]|nr:PIG-L family deacetylase [Bryobacteraceae bacterium]
MSGAAEAKLALDRLNVVASVLMIAAHPDDENTALLAYLARGRKVRTGYLSLTRGEGGQNLIGPEQGDALGLIRTQELLAARRIDGAEQFFTRAIDFGFTKTPQEAFEKWGREKILSDVVWIVRRFQPDVIVLRFTGTPRDGHGQHQASAILGKEAFSAAADPARFPEQLQYVKPWQAQRLMWNAGAFTREQEQEIEKAPDKIEVDPGEYDPVLGYSYAEIAGMSRSQHRSQGMGSPERKGSAKTYLLPVAGEPAKHDLFDGIDTTWNRFAGGAAVGPPLEGAARTFDPRNPAKILPLLLRAQRTMAQLHQPLVAVKQQELEDAIAICSGLWLDATADKFAVAPGGALRLSATAVDREKAPAAVESVQVEGMVQATTKDSAGALPFNEPKVFALSVTVPANEPLSQPYWLREPKQGETYTVSNPLEIGLAENPPLLRARFHLRLQGETVEVVRPVIYRYIERAQGELTRPLIVQPPVAVQWSESARLFPDNAPKSIGLQVTANVAGAWGDVQVQAPGGWNTTPGGESFQLAAAGQEASFSFDIRPPAGQAKGVLAATARVGDQTVAVGMETIRYPHIPPQVLFSPARIELVRSDVKLLAKAVGYVMGAGDEVPEALRQLGADVVLLGPDELLRGDLGRFDAIVTGVRAYNTRPDLRANQERLLQYVQAGGTLVVQYNVPEGGGRGGRGPQPASGQAAAGRRNQTGRVGRGGEPSVLDHIGPYPIAIGGDRVTVEDSAVQLPHPESPLLHRPNEITARDFEGWVQERGLNFASQWDSRYQPLFETHDPGEKPLLGGTLYTRYGKGAYVFTAFSWFRQLPAGVPGAFRLFANLLSAGKTL